MGNSLYRQRILTTLLLSIATCVLHSPVISTEDSSNQYPEHQNGTQCPPDYPNCHTGTQCPPDFPNCHNSTQCPPDYPNCHTGTQCPPDFPNCHNSTQCPPDYPNCHTGTQCPPDYPDCNTGTQCPPENPDCQTSQRDQCPQDDPACHGNPYLCKKGSLHCISNYTMIAEAFKEQGGYSLNNLPAGQVPEGYPNDYYERLAQPFPRRDFVCPSECGQSCSTKPSCYGKDFMYMFTLDLLKNLTVEEMNTGMVLIYFRGLRILDDHISCEDMMKVFHHLMQFPLEDQMDMFVKANISETIDDISKFIPILHLLKDRPLRHIICKLSDSAKQQIRDSGSIDCRVQQYLNTDAGLQQCESSSQCPPDNPNCHTGSQCPPDNPNCHTGSQCPPDNPNCHTGSQCPPDNPDCHSGSQYQDPCPPDEPTCMGRHPLLMCDQSDPNITCEFNYTMIAAMLKQNARNDFADLPAGQYPDSYPKDYDMRLRRPFPRRNYRCPIECKISCSRRPHCFGKDYTYMFTFDIMRKASTQEMYTGIILQNFGGLKMLDDHISCDDMRKVFHLFMRFPLERQMQLLVSINSTDAIDDISDFIPVLQFLKDQPMVHILSKLSENAKQQMCSKLNYLDCRLQMNFIKEIGLQACTSTQGKESDLRPELVLRSVFQKYGDPKQWNNTVWRASLTEFGTVMFEDRNIFRMFPLDVFYEMFEQLEGPTHCKDPTLPKDIKAMILDKLNKLLKANKNDDTKTAKLVGFLTACGGNIKQIAKFATDTQILNSFDSSSAKLTGKDKAAMRQILKKEKSDPSTMTKDEIVQFSSLILNDVRMMRRLNMTALEEAMCDIGSRVQDINQARKLKSILKTMDSYNNLTTYTKDQILCLKKLLGTLTPSEVDNLPQTPLGEALSEGALNDVEFSCQVASRVLKKYAAYVNRPNGDLQTSNIIGLPPSVKKCLRPRDIGKIAVDQLTLEAVQDLLQTFMTSNANHAKNTMRSIFRKIKDSTAILTELAKTPLGKFIPPHLLRSKVDMGQQIADQLLSGQPLTVKADCKKARYLYKELTRVIGPPESDNMNWTTEMFNSLQDSNILSGMPLGHMRGISNSTMFEVADAFLESDCISGNQKKIVLEKYMSLQQVNASTVTAEDIETMDPEILFNQNPEKLQEYGEDHRASLCEVIGRKDVSDIPLDQIYDKAQFCSSCMDLTEITLDNMTSCGSLMCALPVSSFEAMNNDVISEHAASLAMKCQWDQQKRKTLVNLALQKGVVNPINNMTDVDLMTLKTLVADIDPEDIANIPADAFSLADSSLIAAFKERANYQKNRRKNGFKNDFTTEEQLKLKEGTVEVFKKIIEIKLSGLNSRKRRSTNTTSTLACDDLKPLGSVGLPALTVDQLNAIPTAEFQDCLLEFGQVTGWSVEQKAALSEMMKTAYGSPSTWTVEVIGSGGSMVQGLNSSEILELNVDSNSITALGQIEGWTDSQKTAAYSVFMTKVKSGAQPSTLTGAEIGSLGNFVCGMTTAQILSISPAAYMETADTVGALLTCSDTQLQAFATLAKDASVYGSNITAWDVAIVSTVGIVIGGLSNNEIASLTPDQIDSIDPNLISYFPVNVLSYFTPTQIGGFSQAQAQSTTTSQRAELSYAQFVQLEAAGGITWSSERPPSPSSAESLTGILEVTLTLLMICYFIV